MTLTLEGLLILGIIVTMMIADMIYDGASLVLASQKVAFCDAASHARHGRGSAPRIATITAPLGGEHVGGRVVALAVAGRLVLRAAAARPVGSRTLVVVAHVGFWTHSTLVLLFLNLLPHSKHFHVITAIPNVFVRSLEPAGRLEPMAENAEKLMEKSSAQRPRRPTRCASRSASRASSTSPGRRSSTSTRAPSAGAARTTARRTRRARSSSPKHLTLALRDHLYSREDEVVHHDKAGGGADKDATADAREHPASPINLDRRRHPPRRPLGVHHVPRLRGAVPGDDLVRRQDRRHAPQPRHGAAASSRTSSQKPVPGHGGQRQPVEPLAHGPRGVERRASASRRWPRSPTRRSSTGSAARPATTTAPRRSRARPPSS